MHARARARASTHAPWQRFRTHGSGAITASSAKAVCRHADMSALQPPSCPLRMSYLKRCVPSTAVVSTAVCHTRSSFVAAGAGRGPGPPANQFVRARRCGSPNRLGFSLVPRARSPRAGASDPCAGRARGRLRPPRSPWSPPAAPTRAALAIRALPGRAAADRPRQPRAHTAPAPLRRRTPDAWSSCVPRPFPFFSRQTHPGEPGSMFSIRRSSQIETDALPFSFFLARRTPVNPAGGHGRTHAHARKHARKRAPRAATGGPAGQRQLYRPSALTFPPAMAEAIGRR